MKEDETDKRAEVYGKLYHHVQSKEFDYKTYKENTVDKFYENWPKSLSIEVLEKHEIFLMSMFPAEKTGFHKTTGIKEIYHNPFSHSELMCDKFYPERTYGATILAYHRLGLQPKIFVWDENEQKEFLETAKDFAITIDQSEVLVMRDILNGMNKEENSFMKWSEKVKKVKNVYTDLIIPTVDRVYEFIKGKREIKYYEALSRQFRYGICNFLRTLMMYNLYLKNPNSTIIYADWVCNPTPSWRLENEKGGLYASGCFYNLEYGAGNSRENTAIFYKPYGEGSFWTAFDFYNFIFQSSCLVSFLCKEEVYQEIKSGGAWKRYDPEKSFYESSKINYDKTVFEELLIASFNVNRESIYKTISEKNKSFLLETSIIDAWVKDLYPSLALLQTDIVKNNQGSSPVYGMFLMLPSLNKEAIPIEIIRRSTHA